MVKKMKNISINKLKDFIGEEVQLNGWIYNLRSVGKIWFAIVRDGTGFVQRHEYFSYCFCYFFIYNNV